MLNLIEDVADFISSSQLIEDKLLKRNKSNKWDFADFIKKIGSKFRLAGSNKFKKMTLPSFVIYLIFVALLCLVVTLGGWPLFVFNLIWIGFAFWFIFFS